MFKKIIDLCDRLAINKMVFSKVVIKKGVERVCAATHIAVTVESVRELRQIFIKKLLQKKLDKEELKKPPQKGKPKPVVVPQFCPDAEMDIPEPLREFAREINEYFDE